MSEGENGGGAALGGSALPRAFGPGGPARVPFGWYGGKTSHLDFILHNLPACEHYVEPFGGSAAVLLARQPSTLETYNDLNGDVVCFFRVLCSDGDELIRRIMLTPYARLEFLASKEAGAAPPADPIERARLFWFRSMATYHGGGMAAGSWSGIHQSPAGVRGAHINTSTWRKADERLHEVAARLRNHCVFENRDAVELIELVDSPDALFYCDPPYAPEARKASKVYRHEMTRETLLALIAALEKCRGKVALSGYACKWMDDRLQDWHCIEGPEKAANASAAATSPRRQQGGPPPKANAKRREKMWMTYPPERRPRPQGLAMEDAA